MSCQKCKSENIMDVGGKCSDCSWANGKVAGKDIEHDGYVLSQIGIGGGDYIEVTYCTDCGQIQGEFPIKREDVDGMYDE